MNNDSEGEYSDEEGKSDEDELSAGIWDPQIITRGPFVQPEMPPPIVQPLADNHSPVLSSDKPVTTQMFLPDIDKPTLLQPEVVPSSSDSTHPDHVVIDIPEPDLTPAMTDTKFTPPDPVVSNDRDVGVNVGATTESAGLRRSDRERRPPQKFTYDELGEPLTLAISSFFQTLGVAFSKAALSPSQCPSWLAMHEGTQAV
ncbi:unnamed protein product [Knipowitschia caucasica]